MTRIKIIRDIFKGNSFKKSILLASQGTVYLFRYHRNMRIIFLSGFAALIMGFVLRLKGIELVALCITVTIVFMAEILNTAIELLMDIVSEQYHVKIKLIKDISAAVVALTCVNALAVGYILFMHKILKRY